MRRILFCLALGLAACGVPKTQYDAAVADANAAKKDRDDKVAAMQKEIDDLKTKLAIAEGRPPPTDEEARAELEELRKQKAAADARLKLFEDFLAKFKSMIEAGKLEITLRRGQIVLALGTDILFDTGKTEIKPEGKAALTEVASALKGVTNRRFQVAGHTDNFPIKTKEFPSNWELSTARAVAVVKLLIEKGVKADVLSAAGYAELDPVQANSNDKGRAKNRRIEITIVPNIEDLVKMPELGVGKPKDKPEDKPKDEPKPKDKPEEKPKDAPKPKK